MTWTAPITAIAGATVASADFNLYVRDNIAETMPALAANVGSMMIVDGPNSLAERLPSTDTVLTSETCTNTTYGNIATVGPTVSVTTGTKAIVVVGARVGPLTSGATGSCKMSWAISGSTIRAADDPWAAGIVGLGTTQAMYTSRWYLATGLTSGVNTFQAKYSVSSGTGNFQYRSLHLIPL